jgi:Tfp pilus assembly protein PilN
LEDPSAARRLKAREVLVFAAFALVYCLFVVLGGHVYGKLNKKENAFRKAARQLETEINRLEQSENYISESEVRELYRLNNQRVLWTGKLETLAAEVGAHVAVTGLRYVHGKLYIEAIARMRNGRNQFNIISDFMSRLKTDGRFVKDFPQVEFLSSKRQEYEGQTYIKFELLCHNERQKGTG